MSKDKTKAGATVPTEEDIRAARFWLQVQEEAHGFGVSPEHHLDRNFPGYAHASYYKRGAAILVRYDLVLSPVFPTEEKETAEAYQALYQKVVTGPLIQFKKDHGKSGRYCGLVLRAAPNMGAAAPLPEEEPAQWPTMENWAYREAVRIVRREERRGTIPAGAITKAVLFAQRVVKAGLAQEPINATGAAAAWPYDLNVDYKANSLKLLPGDLGRQLAGGVAQYGTFYYYLTTGGQGRVNYITELTP